MAITKEQLRQIIKENDLKSAKDVSTLLKDSFKELLQELLEAVNIPLHQCVLSSDSKHPFPEK